MVTFSVDFATLGPTVLVLILSMVLGTVAGFLGFIMSGAGQLLFGFVETIASGGRSSSSYNEPKINKFPVFLRSMIYLAVCIGAIWLALIGYAGFSYLFAIVGGITLPIAVLKLLK